MKALVKYADKAGSTEIRDVPIPEIGPNDVLLKVEYAGICGTDPHIHQNEVSLKVNIPIILGHEYAGIIKETGENVKDFKIGDRVTGETHAEYCGKCIMCRTNNYHECRDRKGFGVHVNGAFAEFMKVPCRILHKIPKNISLREAALTEPLCVAYNSLVKCSKICPGDFVVVIGPGPIGLLCSAVARLLGASDIIVIGTRNDEKRLQIAKQFDATKTINSSLEEPRDIIMKMRDQYGADSVIDTAGSTETLKLSMDIIKPCGQINKIGWGPKPAGIPLDPLIAKSVSLQGTFSHTWDVWEKCLLLMERKMIRVEDLITDEIPLKKWNDGFNKILTKEGLKIVFNLNL